MSGYSAAGFRMQSELLPSACMVELPSKPQLGMSARVGGCPNSLRRVLPRSSGTGCLPSSQMYSNLYFVISFGEKFLGLFGRTALSTISDGANNDGSPPESHCYIVDESWGSGNNLAHR